MSSIIPWEMSWHLHLTLSRIIMCVIFIAWPWRWVVSLPLMIFLLFNVCKMSCYLWEIFFFDYLLEKLKNCVVGKINKRKKLLSLSGLADEGRVCVMPFMFVLVSSYSKLKNFSLTAHFPQKLHIKKIIFSLNSTIQWIIFQLSNLNFSLIFHAPSYNL